MSNSLVKGLVKGLKYISQIFDSEKEAEMQIGNPTDVKHVAHIGWEGPSVNSPSWMNRFRKQPPVDSCNSEDCGQRGSKSAARIPKSSRRPSSNESPIAGERSDRPKARRSSKSKSSDQKQTTDQTDSPTLTQPDIPRTGRRKKTSRSKAQVADTNESPPEPGFVSAIGCMSISNDSGLCKNIEEQN